NVQIIGQLDQVTVSSGYLVTPFVGIVSSPFTVSPNEQEVKSVISIPVSALLEPDCFAAELKADGRARIIYHFRYKALDMPGRHRENSQTVAGGGLRVPGKRQTDLG